MAEDAQYHFDPDTYLAMIREEIPHYETLQREITRAVAEFAGADPPRVLDLGTGTGSTARAVLDARSDAQLVLLDESPEMVAVAREIVPAANVEDIVIADLADSLPAGPFDIVVSALAIHHLDGNGKQALFTAVHDRLRAGGRFAMADVVVPDDPTDAVIPLTPEYDMPDRAADLGTWLRAAGFRAEQVWSAQDLVAFVADK